MNAASPIAVEIGGGLAAGCTGPHARTSHLVRAVDQTGYVWLPYRPAAMNAHGLGAVRWRCDEQSAEVQLVRSADLLRAYATGILRLLRARR